ncbi:hypothetical protein N8648_05550 [Verrucomicrobia bacterium]|nr:hypothetical protein [Verrucomicrobiota bacterium]
MTEIQLKNYPIYDKRIKYYWLTVQESNDLLKIVDLLFLPFSFENCSHLEVKTVYATKTLNYLTSRTPILVFSPKDSFHSVSGNKFGWGYVVDVNCPKYLADNMVNICNNENTQISLVTNAYKEAKNRDSTEMCNKLENDLAFLEDRN